MVDAGETDPLNPDTDGDTVNDGNDAFPLDPAETLDTDRDGIGNNADTDDDNDSIPDTIELLVGRDPLVADWAVSAGSGHTCALDDTGVVCWGFDVYGQVDAPTLSNPVRGQRGRISQLRAR